MVAPDAIIEAARLMKSSNWLIAFTGAGLSEESGISTYRDPGGLWDRYPEGASGGIMGILRRHPEAFHDLFSALLKTFKSAAPNPGHHALATLEKAGYLKSVITQNGDNLYQDAGGANILELHGNAFRFRCLECGRKQVFSRNEVFAFVEDILLKMKHFSMDLLMPLLPPCECKGKMRPDVVGFGEAVQQLDQAVAQAGKCDLMLIMGTSGVVYPAAMLPIIAKENGAKLIEINPKESALTAKCDLFLPGKTGKILPMIVEQISAFR
ncbi:MAG: NAD-dependent deacylase [Desulfobacterales bacterium]|nr:NAD-dependent deacylase [Desulfobacterales bacterium]